MMHSRSTMRQRLDAAGLDDAQEPEGEQQPIGGKTPLLVLPLQRGEAHTAVSDLYG
jgi:hypothetical protein